MPSSNSNTTTPSCRLQQRFSQQRYQKTFTTRVRLLDEQELTLNFDTKILGKEMFQSVCETIKLLETSYFGLKVIDQVNEKRWLDDEKLVVKQSKKFLFSFSLKFYIPDPNQLEDEFTRYLYALQIKRDLANGDLACAEKTAALLASYIVQAELGDFLGSYDMEGQYLQGKQFYPNQTSAKQIAQNHCQHIGMSAAGADINMLNIVRKTEFYGMNLQSAMDHDDVALSLCAAYSGILVFQNTSRVNTFVWAKIRKINFKRKKLLIKLLSDNYGYHKDIVEFYFQSRDTCKNFWKCCIENHSFFRCVTVKDVIKRNKVILTRGSSFRYTGPTLLEAIDHSKDLLATGQITYKTFNRFYENRRKKIPQTSAPNPTTSEQNVEQYIVSRATHICNPATQHFNPVDYPNNTNISSVTSQQNNRYHHHHYAMHPADLHNVQHQHDVGSTSARLSTCECDSSTHGSRTLDGGSERLDRSMSSVLNSSGDDDDELVSSQKPSAPTTSRRSAAVKVATVIRPISAGELQTASVHHSDDDNSSSSLSDKLMKKGSLSNKRRIFADSIRLIDRKQLNRQLSFSSRDDTAAISVTSRKLFSSMVNDPITEVHAFNNTMNPRRPPDDVPRALPSLAATNSPPHYCSPSEKNTSTPQPWSSGTDDTDGYATPPFPLTQIIISATSHPNDPPARLTSLWTKIIALTSTEDVSSSSPPHSRNDTFYYDGDIEEYSSPRLSRIPYSSPQNQQPQHPVYRSEKATRKSSSSFRCSRTINRQRRWSYSTKMYSSDSSQSEASFPDLSTNACYQRKKTVMPKPRKYPIV